MNTKLAMKETIKFMLQHMNDENIHYIGNDMVDSVSEQMANDDEFLEYFTAFMSQYLTNFGGNYGV